MESSTKRNEFLRFFFSILFRHPQKIRQALWPHNRVLKLSVNQKLESIGTIFVNPLTCWNYGILDYQIVRLNLTLTTVLGDEKPIEKLMKIRVDCGIEQGLLLVSRNDMFNMFRGYTPSSVQVDGLIPSFVLRNPPIPTVENAKLSRVRQHDVPNNIHLNKDHLYPLFSSQNVFYKNDIIQFENFDAVTSKTTNLFYKVEVNSSPCIIDSSTSVYESSPSPSLLPFSNFELHSPITKNMKNTINRMTQIYFAQKKIDNKSLVFLISGASGSGKRLVSSLFASTTHRNMLEIDAYQLANENPATSEAKISSILDKAKMLRHVVLYVRNAHVIAFDPYNGIDRRVLQHIESKLSEPSKITVILSCITDKLTQMPAAIRSLALYSFVAEYFEEEDRINWLSFFIKSDDVLVQQVAKKTSGFTLAELDELIRSVQLRKTIDKSAKINLKMFEIAIDKRNANFADAIGAPKIPNVKWSDVGGLEEAKQTVVESIRTNLFGNRALKRSGIILYGAPGCGKTLIAKAIATEFNIAFLSVKGPELLNKYVGQSEENLRKVFERAKQASPCVIFFDEIDSLAPNRGKNGDSGGVIDRIVSQLLAELDKLHNSPRTKVFVMGATNRPDLLDSSLLTPGRFDKMVEITPGNDVESKTKILEAISRKMNFHEDVDLREIASKVSETVSGAQLFSIISNAAMQAIIEKIQLIENEETKDDVVKVCQRHLIESVQKFQPTKS